MAKRDALAEARAALATIETELSALKAQREAFRPIMVPGGTGAIDTLNVTHRTNGAIDGISSCTFKSFEMRSEKMQTESVDVIWVDERCSEEIYSELLARTTATDGIVFLSYTPLKGGGSLTYRFLNEYSPDRSDTRIEARDAKHITPGAAGTA
jgi:phage terminase large subunit-like protein